MSAEYSSPDPGIGTPLINDSFVMARVRYPNARTVTRFGSEVGFPGMIPSVPSAHAALAICSLTA
jgi:hypothetical protein